MATSRSSGRRSRPRWSSGRRRVEDAIAKTQAVLKNVDELETARKKRTTTPLRRRRQIGRSCGLPHAHREKLPDGSYEIK
jgi:hypothetical protein